LRRFPPCRRTAGRHMQAQATTVSASAWASSRLGRQATVVVPNTHHRPRSRHSGPIRSSWFEYGSDYEAAEKARIGNRGVPGGVVHLAIQTTRTSSRDRRRSAASSTAKLPGEVTVIAPVGGGGLLSGYAYGHDHARACTSSASSQTSRVECPPQSPPGGSSACPWARPSQTGLQQISSRAPSRLVSWLPPSLSPVDDDELRAAMRWLFARHGLVAEGSGAAAVAALLSHKVEIPGRLVVVVTGP